MVRLKASLAEMVLNANDISIPYGAIKRNLKKLLIEYMLIFQFLMVRLKEMQVAQQKQKVEHFNSLWCD